MFGRIRPSDRCEFVRTIAQLVKPGIAQASLSPVGKTPATFNAVVEGLEYSFFLAIILKDLSSKSLFEAGMNEPWPPIEAVEATESSGFSDADQRRAGDRIVIRSQHQV